MSGGGGEENVAFLPLSPPAPRKRPLGPVSCRVRGADPEPTAGSCAAPGHSAHLLVRASALSPPLSSPPFPVARAASCDTGYQSSSSLLAQQRPALGYRGKQDRGGVGGESIQLHFWVAP